MSDVTQPSRRDLLAGAAAAGALTSTAVSASATSPVPIDRIVRRSDGFSVIAGPEATHVRIAHPGVASVLRQPTASPIRPGLDFAAQLPLPGPVRFDEDAQTLRAHAAGIVVALDKRSGRLSFLTPDGERRLAEDEAPVTLEGVVTSRRQGFRIGRRERLHGLGQFREPHAEYRDKDVFLAQANSDAVNLFLISSGGWGLLWDTGTAAYLRSRGDRLGYHSVAGQAIRYHICLGQDMDAVIGGYRALTGAASLLPRWAYGYWQSKESYARQVDLIEVVKEYRRRGLPLDAIVLDYKYWGGNANFSGMKFDPTAFPDPRAMIQDVHAADVHLVASIWPAFGIATTLYRDMAAGNHLLPGDHWSGGKVFDVTSPAARQIYWRAIKKGLIDIGVDGLWTDGNEPELRSTGERYGTSASYAANGRITAGPIDENLLTFSWYQAKGLSEAMRRDLPAKRPVILSRSAYAGQQAFGAITWSGDIFASWGTLTNQITAALNFSMSGNPWWTCDIGAFLVFHRYPDALSDPAYKELYVRWFQFGAFLPMFRAHGTHVPRELWQFGSPGDPYYDALESALRLRYTLMPYIYSLAAAAAHDGDTPLRGLAMDYPDDADVRDQPATFSFGRDLLVRVVDRPMFHASENIQEFLPNSAVQGVSAPAATIEYYEGADFDRFVSKRLTDDIKMSWAGDLPSALAGKPYSLRWTGRIVAQESGPTRISLIGKGAIHFVFDGKTVVKGDSGTSVADGANGGVSFRGHEGDAFYGFDVDLVAGRAYDFTLEQRQVTADAVSLWLEWVTPSIRARQRLPKVPEVEVALPAGRDWYDLRTCSRFQGGSIARVATPLATHPVFVRAGAILPLAPRSVRTGSLACTIELRIHAGHDGSFVLYDDEGDGPGHVRGESAKIPLTWSDASSTLTIGSRIGQFRGMRKTQGFKVTMVDGSGLRTARVLSYDGSMQSVVIARDP